MEKFKIQSIIDGNTFEVTPNWRLPDGTTGNLVHATGYSAPKTGKRAIAVEQKLSIMLQNKTVELGNYSGNENGQMFCEVYFDGHSMAETLRELQDIAVDD